MSTAATLTIAAGRRERVQPPPFGDEAGDGRLTNPTTVWNALVNGRITIVGHGVDDVYASLFITARTVGPRPVCRATDAAVLENLLSGCVQKKVAMDLGVSLSTACSRGLSVLRAFGLTCSVRHAPLLLAMIAASHAMGDTFSAPVYQEIHSLEPGALEVRMLRPEPALRPCLSATEYEVLRAIVEGYSHAQLGVLRTRSPRTISNQVRSIAAKLGVCGRFEYIKLAMARSSGRGRSERGSIGSWRPHHLPEACHADAHQALRRAT